MSSQAASLGISGNGLVPELQGVLATKTWGASDLSAAAVCAWAYRELKHMPAKNNKTVFTIAFIRSNLELTERSAKFYRATAKKVDNLHSYTGRKTMRREDWNNCIFTNQCKLFTGDRT
jgi:hypothetical protein